MSEKSLQAGDWVQSKVIASEPDFTDKNGIFHPQWIHAKPGAVGHVLELEDDEIVTVYFERSGTICSMASEELGFLCSANGPIKPSRPSQNVNAQTVSHLGVLTEIVLTKRASLDAIERIKPKRWKFVAETLRAEIAALEAAATAMEKR